MTIRHDRRQELPLYTVRVVLELDATDRIDNRNYWTHEESIDKRHHPCCVKWNATRGTWDKLKSACPVGTHDHFIGTAWAVYAHTKQPWKRRRKRVNRKNRPDVAVHLVGRGEIARQLYTADPFGKFLIEGHITVQYNRGRLWQNLNVFSVKEVTDEQINSQLSVIAFDRFRQTVKAMATEMPRIPPKDTSFAAQIQERRAAISRGEVRSTLRASEVERSFDEGEE